MMADELSSAIIGLCGVALGSIISTVASFILARTERKKFARDRIWDVRREVYTKIIATMGDISVRRQTIATVFRMKPGAITTLKARPIGQPSNA